MLGVGSQGLCLFLAVGTCTLWWRLKGQGFKAILGYIANKRPDWATRDYVSKIKK